MNDQNYSYEVLTSNEDARACAQLISNVFTKSNEVTMSYGMSTEQHFEETSLPWVNKVLEEHLSLFARNRTTQEIVGCIINSDFYLTCFHHDPNVSAHSLSDFFDELDDMVVSSLNEELKPNMILHIALTATKENEGGKGLATHLSRLACKHAQQTRGFRYAHVQPTHPATKHIYLKKFNGKIVSEINPTTWVWKKGGNIIPYKEWTTGSIPNILFSFDESEKSVCKQTP
jgi:hypothetical protein